MSTRSRATAALMILSLTLGVLLAVPPAARADEPITVGKPIIHKDPKPQPAPPKGNAAAGLPGG